MLSVKRILRDYEEAGSVNSLISLWGFVDDAAFLTKAGHVGIVYQLRGIDYEGLTHAQRAAIVHRLEAALRVLDEHWRVYEYVVKRNIPPLRATSCSQPLANEAIQERVSYLNGGFVVEGPGPVAVNGFEISVKEGEVLLANQRIADLRAGEEVYFPADMKWRVRPSSSDSP